MIKLNTVHFYLYLNLACFYINFSLIFHFICTVPHQKYKILFRALKLLKIRLRE